MFNFVSNYEETPHYSDDKLGIYKVLYSDNMVYIILHLERGNIMNSNQGSLKFQKTLVAFGTIHVTF
jgi:hypothetical protein